MSLDEGFAVELEQIEDLQFKVSFDWENVDDLVMDEPEPLGSKTGPNASRILAAAVGNCLTASLVFCLQRSRSPIQGVKSRVQGKLARNEKNRIRIAEMKVTIELPKEAGEIGSSMDRCLGLFEDFCVVTASVRQGIPIEVEVVDHQGKTIQT
jgi:uncharacterized OsmC-like protein